MCTLKKNYYFPGSTPPFTFLFLLPRYPSPPPPPPIYIILLLMTFSLGAGYHLSERRYFKDSRMSGRPEKRKGTGRSLRKKRKEKRGKRSAPPHLFQTFFLRTREDFKINEIYVNAYIIKFFSFVFYPLQTSLLRTFCF